MTDTDRQDDFLAHYILDADHRPVKVSLMEWAKWYEAADRRVAATETKLFWISTVFLGINHQWRKGPPLIFETMVFEREAHDHPQFVGLKVREELDGEQWRYASWDAAVVGHAATVRRVKRLEAEAMAKVVRRQQEEPKP